jgi:DNA-binding MarR family transcriptional regulator
MPVQLRLNKKEQMIVDLLKDTGAMTPSQIAVQTLMLPSETYNALRRLEKDGYVIMRETPDSADGSMVVLTGEIRSALVKLS